MYAILFWPCLWIGLIPSALANPFNALPRIGDDTRIYLTESMEQQIARQMIRHFSEKQLIVDDPLLNHYIQSLGQRLVAASEPVEFEYHFFWLNHNEINAFAAPAAHISLHTGLLLFTESESELAAVIAHEIAHVSRRHIGRLFADSQRMAIPTMAAMIAGAALAAASGSDAGVAAMAGVAGASAQRRLTYSRAFEQEADRLGRQILQRAGFEIAGLRQFLERLQRQSRSENRVPEYLLTHPHLENRIGDTQDFSAPHTTRITRSSLEYDLMKMRARVLVTNNRQALLQNLQQRASSPANRYGLALLLIQNGDFHHAKQQVNLLRQQSPEQLIYLLLAAELAQAQGDFSLAQEIYEQARRLHGNDQRLLAYYGHMLVTQQRGREALDLLNALLQQQPDRNVWRLVAQAAEGVGDVGRLNEALAEFHYLSGDLKAAIAQLENGLRHKDTHFFYQARLKTRLLDLQNQQKDERRDLR